jgi:hypothetical protein
VRGAIRLITFSNDEIRMPNDEVPNKVSILVQLFVILLRHLGIDLGMTSVKLAWFCAGSTFSTLSYGAELFSAAGKSCKSREGSA